MTTQVVFIDPRGNPIPRQPHTQQKGDIETLEDEFVWETDGSYLKNIKGESRKVKADVRVVGDTGEM